jgi:hypothetical protein
LLSLETSHATVGSLLTLVTSHTATHASGAHATTHAAAHTAASESLSRQKIHQRFSAGTGIKAAARAASCHGHKCLLLSKEGVAVLLHTIHLLNLAAALTVHLAHLLSRLQLLLLLPGLLLVLHARVVATTGIGGASHARGTSASSILLN